MPHTKPVNAVVNGEDKANWWLLRVSAKEANANVSLLGLRVNRWSAAKRGKNSVTRKATVSASVAVRATMAAPTTNAVASWQMRS